MFMGLQRLVHSPIKGVTIYRYEVTGGKKMFLGFTGYYLGKCNFYKNIDDDIA